MDRTNYLKSEVNCIERLALIVIIEVLMEAFSLKMKNNIFTLIRQKSLTWCFGGVHSISKKEITAETIAASPWCISPSTF